MTAGTSISTLRRRAAVLAGEGPAPWTPGSATALLDLFRDVAGAIEAELPSGSRAIELQALGRRIVEEGALAPLLALERVRDAATRLGEAGPVSEVIERAPGEVAGAVGLDRVVLGRVEEGYLVVAAIHAGPGDEALRTKLKECRVRLAYPLVEAEIARLRQARLIRASGTAGARMAYSETMHWSECVVAPIVIANQVVGFFHGDLEGGARELRPLHREALAACADAVATNVERAVLRRRLRTQRQELRQVASWADARTSELNDAAISLATESWSAGTADARPAEPFSSRLHDLLTRREHEVLEHMAAGETNAGIAQALVVSPGTIKFHVKNILRKLGAANRAEAISRYMHLHPDRGLNRAERLASTGQSGNSPTGR